MNPFLLVAFLDLHLRRSSLFRRGVAMLCSIVLMLASTSQGYAYFTDCNWPIMVREMKIENANLEEAVAYLRIRTRMEDNSFDKKSVNIVIKDPLGRINLLRRVSLEAHDVPLKNVVQVLAAALGVKVRVEPYALVFSPD